MSTNKDISQIIARSSKQAKGSFLDDVKGDISNYMDDWGRSLSNRNLGTDTRKQKGSNKTFEFINYAKEFVNGDLYPKNKNMFKVSLFLNTDIINELKNKGFYDSFIKIDSFSFLIKDIELPKIDFEYQEVDMYNYRTKILKNTKFNNSISFSLYDDAKNSAVNLLISYLTLIAPIVNNNNRNYYENNTFKFSNKSDSDSLFNNPSFLQTLSENYHQFFSGMTITHYNRKIEKTNTNGSIDSFYDIIIYKYHNTRIDHIDFGELSYEEDDFKTLKISMNFDSFNVLTSVPYNSNDHLSKHDMKPIDIELYKMGTFLNKLSGPTSNPLANWIYKKASNTAKNIIGQTTTKVINKVVENTLNRTKLATKYGGIFAPVVKGLGSVASTQSKNYINSGVNALGKIASSSNNGNN